MTMFKTKEQIEDMAFPWFLSDTEVCEAFEDIKVRRIPWTMQRAYVAGYTQAQKDLLESAGEGFNDWLWGVNFGGTTQTEISRMKLAWEMATLSSKAQIDTLKQRELEYQSDLREKDRIINEKSNQIIEMNKELKEKDEWIKDLERKIKSIDCYIAADEKYQEVIKDIEWLLTDCDQDLYTHLDKIDEIKTKYGLDKKKDNMKRKCTTLKELIEKLKNFENEFKDSEVVVDFETYEDEVYGYYNLEDVSIVKGDDNQTFINIKSSNED